MARKRVRWIVGLLIAAPILAVGAFIGDREWTRYKGDQKLAATIAQIEQDDPDWRFEMIDRGRPAVGDDANGALLVPKFLAALPPKPNFENDPVLNSDAITQTPPNQRHSEAVIKALDAQIAKSEQALTLAHAFKDFPKGRFHRKTTPIYISTLLPNVQESRSVARLLDWHAEWLLEQNRLGDAAATTTAMWNVSHTLADDPYFICSLVRVALLHVTAKRVERLLALRTLSDVDLARFQQELEAEAKADLFWYALRAERGGMSMLFDGVQVGMIDLPAVMRLGDDPASVKSTGSEVLLGRIAYSPLMGHDHAAYLDLMTRAYAVRKLPEGEQRAALQAIEEEVKTMRTVGALKHKLTSNLAPSLIQLFNASQRTTALLRCATLGVACERFRVQQGRWPNTLDELPAALAPFKNDPFTGKPLRLKPRADGLTIYSIGADDSDDGGAIFDVPPAVSVKVDYGFRLYNPDQRNRPAK